MKTHLKFLPEMIVRGNCPLRLEHIIFKFTRKWILKSGSIKGVRPSFFILPYKGILMEARV
jgi:hypothetical protein